MKEPRGQGIEVNNLHVKLDVVWKCIIDWRRTILTMVTLLFSGVVSGVVVDDKGETGRFRVEFSQETNTKYGHDLYLLLNR